MNELTLDDSQPVEIYEFSSIYQTYRYTSDNIDWVVNSNTYQSISGLRRTSIKIGTHENDKDKLKIYVPLTVDVASDWAFQTTPPDMKIVVKRIDRANNSTYTIWKGKVSFIKVEKHNAVFECPSLFTSVLSAKVPSIMVQTQCNHVLFDTMCGVDRASYSYQSTVVAKSGTAITLNHSPPPGNSLDYVNGEILATVSGERRTISSIVGNTVNVVFEMGLEIGDAVEVTQGCDHIRDSLRGCAKFNNKVNFGGFPFISGEDKNIFQVGVI